METSGKNKIPVVKTAAARKESSDSEYNNAAFKLFSMSVFEYERKNSYISGEVVSVHLSEGAEKIIAEQGFYRSVPGGLCQI